MIYYLVSGKEVKFMNLLHLKYAVEIAQTNSMTKAAENLYTAQPNLLSGHSGAGEHP